MAQDGAKWQKGQDVEIYDPSQEKWILGTIYDIRQEDGQNIYSVEYDEYSQDIHQKNAPTHLRSPNTAEKTDDREAEETFLNFSEQIAPKLPKSKQMTILSKSVRGIASQQRVTWRGVTEAVKQELYPKMYTAFAKSLDECLQKRTVRLTDLSDDAVDALIRQLKINKKSLLNKEIDYIKGLVARTIEYNDYVQNETKTNQQFNLNSHGINKNDESFFRYNVLNDIPNFDPNTELNPNPKWKGLTANLVLDIYGIFKAMKYGAFQRENYSKSHFIDDIKKAETNILKDGAVSSLMEEIDIESAVSFHPQYVIKDDLFETVNPLLAMSLVLNKLESEQIGNGIKIKCVVVPALITSIYDGERELESNIESISEYLIQRAHTNPMIVNKLSVKTDDIPQTAQALNDMIKVILALSQSANSISTVLTEPPSSTPSNICIVFNRRAFGTSSATVSVHVFAVNDQSALALSDLDYNYFMGMEMEMTPEKQSNSQFPSTSPTLRCWLRFGVDVRIRFLPEQLLWIIPSLFARSSSLKPYDFWSRVYGADYKHRWSVSLEDDILSKFHHVLTGNVLCSVNYHRSYVTVHHDGKSGDSVDGLRDHLEQKLDVVQMESVQFMISDQCYDSDAVVEDAMVIDNDSNLCRHLNGPKSREFHQLKYAVMKYLKIGCDVHAQREITGCPFVEDVIQNLIKFERFGLEIDASNLFEFSLSPLVKGLDHLYRVHEYGITSGPNRQSIRRHVLEHVQCHLGAGCPIVQQHGDRKRENARRRADRQKEAKQDDDDDNSDGSAANDEVETECEALRDSLCAAHSYLLHDNDELYRLRLAAAELRFATEVVDDAEERKEDEVKNDDKKEDEETERDPLSINYGESVLEWLSHGESAQFESLREELVYNDDSTMDRNLLARMTIQCAAAIEGTDYTLKEALGLKTYADATAFQSELRKAHWKGISMKIKKAYFNWAMTLYEAHLYHAMPIPAISGTKKPRGIFHGLNRMFTMNHELPIYLGPFSVSTSKTVAKQFSNEKGLLFTIAPSYANPFKFSVGINMITFSSFKNEAEVLFNNQPIPIKKTETFGDAMTRFVMHFLFSLKTRKTRINDVAAFYNKLGVDWNDEWIPLILKHKLLFAKTRFNGRKTVDRLFSELGVFDQRLVDSVLQMHHDGKPYVVYLVENLKVRQLLQHYRLMTSGFSIMKYSHQINSSWLKWEPNNKMNDEFAIARNDDSCFEDAEYSINDAPVSTKSHFVPNAVRKVSVRHPDYFGDQIIAVHGQRVERIHDDAFVAHDFGGSLTMDGYSNGCVFVDDIPRSDYHFEIGQLVKCNDDSIGKISRVSVDAVCVKLREDHMTYFRWFEKAKYTTELTLHFHPQRDLNEYVFAVSNEVVDDSNDLSAAEKYKFAEIGDLEIPSDSRFIQIYVQKMNHKECKWGRIGVIDHQARQIESEMSRVAISSVDGLLRILQKTSFEIIDGKSFLQKSGLNPDQNQEQMQKIDEHPLLFATTTYRRRLVIERLIVEFKLWNIKWIHRILEQKIKDKPMLKWLVEQRKVAKLHDHYRLYTSVDVYSSALLRCRWLKYSKNTTMIGKPGFNHYDDSYFKTSQYHADRVPITSTTASVKDSVRQITVKNEKLFGGQVAVLHDFKETDEEDGEEQVKHLHDLNHFVNALRVDQYSNGCIFVDDIPTKTYPFSEGQQIQFNDGQRGKITRMTNDAICVKMKSVRDKLMSFRWILRSEGPKRFTLTFKHHENLDELYFAAAIGGNQKSINLSALKENSFANIANFRIPCPGLLGHKTSCIPIDIYAKPRINGYLWVRIKTLDFSSLSDSMGAVSNKAVHDGGENAVNALIMAIATREMEIRDSRQVLKKFGLSEDRKSEWMSVIFKHSMLFDATAYRRRLIIERLIVELKLWNTDWIHRILDEKMNDKPMLQWLIEDREIVHLYDHYRIYMSRFTVHHSPLLNVRWLIFEENVTMNGKPGFPSQNTTCFEETEYKADGITISPREPAVSGAVRQITVNNITLFGERSVILQEFDKKNDDDYFSDDFADALCCDGEACRVFLNRIPSNAYAFCVGQELHFNDSFIGNISRVTSDKVCVKCHLDDMVFIRWIEKSEISNECVLGFRYRDEMYKYCFMVTKGQKSAEYIASQRDSLARFSDLDLFEMKSATVGDEDQICIYVKPREGTYQWICIKSMKAIFENNFDENPTSTLVNQNDFARALDHLFLWLRKRVTSVKDPKGVVAAFGLDMDQCSQWITTAAGHPLLFAITAHRRRLLIERLVLEFDLFSNDLAIRMMREKKGGKWMLEWLVENHKVKRLYDHYRIAKSGFFVSFRSDLFDVTWLRFQRATNMSQLREKDDSIFEKTKYIIDGTAYHMDTTIKRICVVGVNHHQMACNSELFGDREIAIRQLVEPGIDCGKVIPLNFIAFKAPDFLSSWYRRTIDGREQISVQLVVSDHRGHYGSRHPKHLLQKGSTEHYDNDGHGPTEEDWIIFEKMTPESIIPTTIIIQNYGNSFGLKSFKLFGSANNEDFEEWITIDNILTIGNLLQHFALDPASIYYAWKRQFRYFRLCSMRSYAVRYLVFYHFEMCGVNTELSGVSSILSEVMRIDENNQIAIKPDIHVKGISAKRVELKDGDRWIDALVSRECAGKICVKWNDGGMMAYRWMQNHDIPMKLQFSINGERQIPEHVFAAVVSCGNEEADLRRSEKFLFVDKEQFAVSLSDLVAYTSSPDTVSIYGRPHRNYDNYDDEYHLIKQLKCSTQTFSRFAVKDLFLMKERFVVKSTVFVVLATAEVIISKRGCVDMSHIKQKNDGKKASIQAAGVKAKSMAGTIHIISGGNVVNEGSLLCNAPHDEQFSGGTVHIDADGVFENKGTIDCGKKGLVIIKCAEFKNDGLIIPNPKVIRKDTKENLMLIEQAITGNGGEAVKLHISDHRGNYHVHHPKRLLEEGRDTFYSSEDRGPPCEDWITFGAESTARVYPITVVIRNYHQEKRGLKAVKIEGSSDGICFEDWIQIGYIHNNNRELQEFAVDPVSGYFAWERAYTHFRVKIVANHGGSCNMFYEFRIKATVGR